MAKARGSSNVAFYSCWRMACGKQRRKSCSNRKRGRWPPIWAPACATWVPKVDDLAGTQRAPVATDVGALKGCLERGVLVVWRRIVRSKRQGRVEPRQEAKRPPNGKMSSYQPWHFKNGMALRLVVTKQKAACSPKRWQLDGYGIDRGLWRSVTSHVAAWRQQKRSTIVNGGSPPNDPTRQFECQSVFVLHERLYCVKAPLNDCQSQTERINSSTKQDRHINTCMLVLKLVSFFTMGVFFSKVDMDRDLFIRIQSASASNSKNISASNPHLQ